MSSPFQVEATNSGGGGELPPPGNYPAVLVGLVDLGTHEEEYQGKRYDARKVLLCWELAGENRSDGGPQILSMDFNLLEKMSAKSKLRKLLEGWRGRPMDDKEAIDLAVLMGKACLLNVGHKKSQKGSDYATILGVTPVLKGMAVPRPLCELFTWHFGAGPFTPPDWLPFLYGKPVLEHIEAARESRAAAPANGRLVGAGAGAVSDDNEIPF